MANTIIRLFKDTNMQNNHDGLRAIARKQKVDLDNLGGGEHVVFLNRALDKVKLYSAYGVISYKRVESGRLNLGIIEKIPECFGAKGMDWDKAEKLAIEKQFKNAGIE